MEFLLEIVFEIVFEIYIELMMHIVPKEKATSRKYKIIASLLALVVLLGTLALFIWGCILMGKYHNELGIIPIAVSIVISVVQIFAGFILHNKNERK